MLSGYFLNKSDVLAYSSPLNPLVAVPTPESALRNTTVAVVSVLVFRDLNVGEMHGSRDLNVRSTLDQLGSLIVDLVLRRYQRQALPAIVVTDFVELQKFSG